MSKKKLKAQMLSVIASIQADISKSKFLLSGEKEEKQREKIKKDIALAIWRMHQAQAEIAKINAIKGTPMAVQADMQRKEQRENERQ